MLFVITRRKIFALLFALLTLFICIALVSDTFTTLLYQTREEKVTSSIDDTKTSIVDEIVPTPIKKLPSPSSSSAPTSLALKETDALSRRINALSWWKEQDQIYEKNSLQLGKNFTMNRERYIEAFRRVERIVKDHMQHKYAFVAYYTHVSGMTEYLPGLIALIGSWKRSNSAFQMVVLSASKFPLALEKQFSKISNLTVHYMIDDLIGSVSVQNNWAISYNKLIAYRLIQYEKVVLLDTDVFFAQNVDELLGMEDMSTAMDACGECTQGGMNAGVVVFSSSLAKWEKIKAYAKKPSCLSKNFRWYDQELLICLHGPRFKDIPERLGDMRQLPIIYNMFQQNAGCKGNVENPKHIRHVRSETKIYHFACTSKPYSQYKAYYSKLSLRLKQGLPISEPEHIVVAWSNMYLYGLSLFNVTSVDDMLKNG